MQRGLRWALALTVCLVGFMAAPAGAEVGDLSVQQCLNAGAARPGCTSAAGLTSAYPQTVSPDGKQVYVAVAGGTPPGGGPADPAAILVFDRSADGRLTRRAGNCITTTGSSGACEAAPRLSNPQDIVVAPDGRHVYVSTAGNATILELSRASDGTLTLKSECQSTGAPCEVVRGVLGSTIHALAISPDGESLYARAEGPTGNGSLLVFDRDASSGDLGQKAGTAGCWTELAHADCTIGAGLSRTGWQMVVSPDGKNLYATGYNDAHYDHDFDPCCQTFVYFEPASGGVAVFARAADGTLSQTGVGSACLTNNGRSGGTTTFDGPTPAPTRCADSNDALALARSAAISADGKHVVVGGATGLVVFARDAATGALTFASCVRSDAAVGGCTQGRGIGETFRMAFTPDGSDLVVESNAASGYALFRRNAETGTLTQRPGPAGCFNQSGSGDCTTVPALGGFGSPSVSADGLSVYLTGNQYGALVTMQRDLAPVCEPRSASVPYQQSVVIGLACSDPNGDPLTISISKPPFNGTVAAVDQGTRTVRYNPSLGFSGPDPFEYTATANGVTSAPARVSVEVAGPVTTRTDADGDGSPAGEDCDDRDARRRPGASEIPGNSIDENCDSRDALAPIVPSRVSVSWQARRVTRVKRLVVRSARAGSTITFKCSGKRRGCPRRMRPVTVRANASALKLTRRFRRMRLRPGAVLEVRIALPGHYGKVSRFEIRSKRRPRATQRCLAPGTGTPTSCPAA